MSIVIKCDCCGAVGSVDDILQLRINEKDTPKFIGKLLNEVDICKECYNKLCSTLNLEVKQ